MGRIIVEFSSDKLIKTRYDSEGSVIPDRITQNKKVVAIIKGNLDIDSDKSVLSQFSDDELAVSREEFLSIILSWSEDCVDRYAKFGKGLYSESDMRRGITWAEVAYLLHYVGGIPTSIDWNTIKPRVEDKVCVLHEISSSGDSRGSQKVLDEKLANYKNRKDIDYYINSIIAGKRYIPLPMYCSFVDLMYNEDIDIDLGLDMMFKRLSKSELSRLF